MIGFYIPRRWVLVLLAHFGLILVYAIRLNITTMMVTLVNNTNLNRFVSNHTECLVGRNASMDVISGTEFYWKQVVQQGYTPNSFFFGYIISQIPAGLLTNRLGGKRLFALGLLGASFMELLTPASVKLGPYVLAVSRFVDGLFEGVTVPAMVFLLAHWSPVQERSRILTFVFAGMQVGVVLTLPLSALLASSRGWPAVFFFFGALGAIHVPIWNKCVKDNPALHSGISEKEKIYIIGSIPQKLTKPDEITVPWKSILLSPPVLAVTCAHFCNNWIHACILTGLPLYFEHVLGFNMNEDGFMSTLPFISAFLFTGGGGIIADYMRKKSVTTTNTRKIMTCIAFLGASAILLAASYNGCEQEAFSLFCLTLATGILQFNRAGFLMGFVDISPTFSGVITGISSSAGTLAGCISPIAIGLFTNEQPTREQYRKIFGLSSGLAVFGTMLICLFGSGEVQPWDKVQFNADREGDQEDEKTPLLEKQKFVIQEEPTYA